MNTAKVKLKDLEKNQAKTDEIINKIIENPDDYDREKLLKVVDAMKDLVKLAEAKLAKNKLY